MNKTVLSEYHLYEKNYATVLKKIRAPLISRSRVQLRFFSGICHDTYFHSEFQLLSRMTDVHNQAQKILASVFFSVSCYQSSADFCCLYEMYSVNGEFRFLKNERHHKYLNTNAMRCPKYLKRIDCKDGKGKLFLRIQKRIIEMSIEQS